MGCGSPSIKTLPCWFLSEGEITLFISSSN